jgi:hypothetical protein
MLYNTPLKKAEQAQDPLSEVSAGLLDIDAKTIGYNVQKRGPHVMSKFVVTEPSEENQGICASKELSRKIRTLVNYQQTIPNQKSKLFVFLKFNTQHTHCLPTKYLK